MVHHPLFDQRDRSRSCVDLVSLSSLSSRRSISESSFSRSIKRHTDFPWFHKIPRRSIQKLYAHWFFVLPIADNHSSRFFHSIYRSLVPNKNEKNISLGIVADSHRSLPSNTSRSCSSSRRSVFFFHHYSQRKGYARDHRLFAFEQPAHPYRLRRSVQDRSRFVPHPDA